LDGTAVSEEVVGAATALAGLILIYIGSQVASYGSYNAQEQKTVKGRFQARAWIAFVGFVLALLAAALGITGKWLGSACTSNVSVWALLAAFAWTLFATVDRCARWTRGLGASARPTLPS
jgi:uncharacterized membrane protein